MTPPIVSSSSGAKGVASGAEPRSLRSTELLKGARRIVIEHGEARYTLLVTRNDKLILVK